MLIGRDNAGWTRADLDAMLVCLDDKNARLVKAVEALKTALLEATPAWRARFLNFVTACSRAFPGIKILVAPAAKGLPTGHTCDNKVSLPLDAVGEGAEEGELVRRLNWSFAGSEGAGIHENAT